MIKNVADKKVDISDKKYSISLRSRTPLPTLSKWVIGLNSCNKLATPLGRVIATISNPIIIKIMLKVSPRMNETIWFLVKLEVNNPIDTRHPARKILARYCDITAPQSKFPAVVRLIGIARVANTAIETNIRPDKNLVIRTTQPLMGCVSKVSKVPSRCSSESNLIVAAGIKSVINQGREGLSIANSTENKGLKDVSPIRSAVLKNAQESIATKITINM
tara:strand:+ start:490 stop:1146 length:657 start_codon:yes stop_codon:yes gene_type:complete